MKVSFIVPLYNCLPLTQAMLASLQATVPAGLSHEIIFIDDGSTDGTRAWLAGLAAPCRVVLNECNLGFAATCNRGAATGTGELLFFLNNDLELLPGWLEPMVALLADRPDSGLVGNVQLNYATGAVDHAGIFFNAKGKPAHSTRRGWAATRPVDAVTGACLGLRRAVWVRLGGFDPGYINGCEDVDLSLRARAAGLVNRVALRSVVRHHVSASLGRKSRDEQNTRRLFQRWHHVIAARIARACAAECLAAAWDEPRDYPDPALARDAFLYRLHLVPSPSARLQAAVATRLHFENLRWARLFDGAPARDEREVAWPFFARPPVRPPVF